MSNAGKILIVEDEQDIGELIKLHLTREGFVAELFQDGAAGLKAARAGGYKLFILDWMLPGMSGLEIARNVRDQGVPILMVTAKTEPADIVLGLESGADDYLTKPFDVPVLLARVRALLRRAAPKLKILTLGEMRLNLDSHQVTCGGEEVSLTVSEFKLLAALAQNQGKVLTRSQLMDLVQGAGVSVVDRTIDTHVFGIRKKLGACGDHIETIRGVGYRVR